LRQQLEEERGQHNIPQTAVQDAPRLIHKLPCTSILLFIWSFLSMTNCGAWIQSFSEVLKEKTQEA
jgi:hypothetical protein